MDVERARLPEDCAEARSRAPSRRETVAERLIEVGDTWPAVEGYDVEAPPPFVGGGLKQDLATVGVLHEVGRHFRDDELHPSDFAWIESDLAREGARDAARFGDLAAMGNRDELGAHHFHLPIITRVPVPGVDSISNSFERRFAPPSPSPRPLPVVYPSFRASGISAIPGPWS